MVYAKYADFSFSNIRDVIFEQSDLSSANFSGVDLAGVEFSGANLTAAKLIECCGKFQILKTDCGVASFDYSDLTELYAYMSHFGFAEFTRADLRGACFDHCVFDGNTRFEGALLDGTSFFNCHIHANLIDDYDFSGAKLVSTTVDREL